MLLQPCWISSPEKVFHNMSLLCKMINRHLPREVQKQAQRRWCLSQKLICKSEINTVTCDALISFCMNLKMGDSCQLRSGENEQGFDDVCALATKVRCSASPSLYIISKYNTWKCKFGCKNQCLSHTPEDVEKREEITKKKNGNSWPWLKIEQASFFPHQLSYRYTLKMHIWINKLTICLHIMRDWMHNKLLWYSIYQYIRTRQEKRNLNWRERKNELRSFPVTKSRCSNLQK